MNTDDLKRVLISFADNPGDLDIDKKDMAIQIRDEVIQIRPKIKDFALYIEESGNDFPVSQWIVNRLARLPQLADRILEYTKDETFFVPPVGRLLEDIDENPDESEQLLTNIIDTTLEQLSKRSPLSSSILYITSDAGEGKTTLINQLARQQANLYKRKQTDWLLLPIPLGGRSFLRFDDIVIASLVNRYRFPVFYYDSFLELVKLGVIVPAFDGFEEMFMESSTGEALSSLGNLINRLQSKGNVLIAARKAYFDYKSFNTQAKLFDSIGLNFVTFSKITIERWSRDQFLSYAEKRQIAEPLQSYSMLSQKLGASHPILTRAVLVKPLLDICSSFADFQDLARKLGTGSTHDAFSHFVDAIIEREANFKWIDRSGEPPSPLLPAKDHHYLLSFVAQEMWINNTSTLREDVFDLITDLFAESKKLSSSTHRQVKERLKQHALLIRPEPNKPLLSFDHDEFQQFFLGEAIGYRIIESSQADVISMLRIGKLPEQTVETVVLILKREQFSVGMLIDLAFHICQKEGQVSFLRENFGAIVIRLVSNDVSVKGVLISRLIFPINSLYCLELNDVTFKDCYFQATSLENTTLSNCHFIDCTCERFDLYRTSNIANVEMTNTEVNCIYDERQDNTVFDPKSIKVILKAYNLTDESDTLTQPINGIIKFDDSLLITEKLLRRFVRSSQLTSNIFRAKLGKLYNGFESGILPVLLKHNILIEILFDGGGVNRRFKLGYPLHVISDALTKCDGSFDNFINFFKK